MKTTRLAALALALTVALVPGCARPGLTALGVGSIAAGGLTVASSVDSYHPQNSNNTANGAVSLGLVITGVALMIAGAIPEQEKPPVTEDKKPARHTLSAR